MFENFFRKSEVEKEQPLERKAELGKRILTREANLEIEPKRSGGFMLCTVLAMALAMGITASKAEAQVRGIGPQGHGFGGQVASEIFNRGVFEAGSTINKAQNTKQDRIEQEYVAQLTRLEDIQRQLDNQYSVQKSQLMKQGGKQGNLKTLEDSYRAGRAQLMKARADLEKEYHRQKRNTTIKRGITEAIFQGVRGW